MPKVFDFFLLRDCSSSNLPEIYAQEFVLCISYFLMLSRDALIGISLYLVVTLHVLQVNRVVHLRVFY